MGTTPTGPIVECIDDFSKRRNHFDFGKDNEVSKKIDKRIYGLAIDRILTRQFGVLSGKLVATIESDLILNIFPQIFDFVPKKKQEKKHYLLNENYHQPTIVRRKKNNKKFLPVGIHAFGINNWINALMQFIIFLPRLSYMFDYAPKCLNSFSIFIDRYLHDQENQCIVTHAKSSELIECIDRIFDKRRYINRNSTIDLYKLLFLMMDKVRSSFFLDINSLEVQQNDLFALHPEWQVICSNPSEMLKNVLENHLNNFNLNKNYTDYPPSLLVYFEYFFNSKKNLSLDIHAKTQFFLSSANKMSICYELDAFIEYRHDEISQTGSYVTYLKIEGTWYQCYDARITLIRSTNLKLALNRSFLFHYKNVPIHRDRRFKI